MADSRKSIMFTSTELGNVTIGNRFVRSATHEWMCQNDGSPTRELGDLLETLAEGGMGLIISGYTFVNEGGISSERQSGIHEDRLIEPHSKVVARVHDHGAKFFMQLVHGGRQAWMAEEKTGQVLGPSAVPDMVNDVSPKEMTQNQIRSTIEDFVAGAGRAKDAGYDGVQLHVAHGFLLSSFISPYTNRRKDRYGGSIENRARIISDIMEGIAHEISSDLPVIVKINSTDGFKEPGKGLQVEDAVAIAKLLEDKGLKGVEVSAGIMEARATSSIKNIRKESEEGYFLEYASKFKRQLDIPVICVGGWRSFKVMERSVQDGGCDMVSLSRPFIMEPDLVDRFRKGTSTRARCISCNKCIVKSGIRCTIDKRFDQK